MPKRNDINKIMIIGSGPIIIGQACEFDYSGTQACKALKSLGYEIVLVNSNPATIMTDPETADVTYIEPLNIARMEEIIAKERPCALLPNLGGQSALNLSTELEKSGILEKYGVKVIGINLDAIERGEDRIIFKETMNKIGVQMALSEPAYSVAEAEAIAMRLNFPVVIRPAFTMGGTGGGIAYNKEELDRIVTKGLQASVIGQVLVEECLLGWQELEVEVIRDAKNQLITICFIENVDPMGVHTGDSFCVAPFLTVKKEIQEKLQEQAYAVAKEIGIIGGANVQFAYNPKDDRIAIIEINPRTSRSSALASKATGLPIAYVSSLLAAGLTLDEIPYWKEGTLDKYKPSGNYVVTKFARFTFDKFKDSEDKLSTQMKAVGEVMSIGKTFKESFLKAIRSLEMKRFGLGFVKDYNEKSREELLQLLHSPSSERQFILYEALKKGATVAEINKLTYITPWFLEQIKEIAELELKLSQFNLKTVSEDMIREAKSVGFSDIYLAKLLDSSETEIIRKRNAMKLHHKWEGIPVSGIEQDSAYYYSSYNIQSDDIQVENSNKKVMILGSGPNRIGQGIEFDYCCVHAAFALRQMGFTTIMVNCNPETVSTDYDTSDRLYFEPLTVEDVLSIYEKEKPIGVITQFGGQTPLNIANRLEKYGVKILGTPTESINLAEDRDLFGKMMEKLAIKMPASGMASTVSEAKRVAAEVGYPVMVRPSFVLGGRGMEVIYDESEIEQYMNAAVGVTSERPILIDRFLSNALECEADALFDGVNAFVPAIMEHIEPAGVHSGDSACVLPPINISETHMNAIKEITVKIAKELNVCGLINIQYAIANDDLYVLEANPRASRTVPLVSKICNIQMAKIATQAIMSSYLEDGQYKNTIQQLMNHKIPYYGVKEAVFPFNMFPEVDPVLGPEMKSTGEVLGLSSSFGTAFIKAQEATQVVIPTTGNVLMSVSDIDKKAALPIAKRFVDLGMHILATSGTYDFFTVNNIPCELIKKVSEGQPNIQDALINENICLVINTPTGKTSQKDGAAMRKTCVKLKIPYFMTLAEAKVVTLGIAEMKEQQSSGVVSIQEYHQMLESTSITN